MDQIEFLKESRHQPKLQEHRSNIAKAMTGLVSYTNGVDNIKQRNDLPVPEGYWRGMTRKKK